MKKKMSSPRTRHWPRGSHQRLWLAACSVGWLIPCAHALAQTAGSNPWQDLDEQAQVSFHRSNTATSAEPAAFRMLQLDRQRLLEQLSANQVELDLPVPEGGYSRFSMKNADAMPAALAKKYPRLQSFKGRDTEGRRVRLDTDGAHVRATVWDTGANLAWSVQPEDKRTGAGKNYIAYRHAALPASEVHGAIDSGEIRRAPLPRYAAQPGTANRQARTASFSGTVLYDFRLAVATDSSYTARFGGTVEGGLAGVVHSVNQLNEIFENDLGVHLTLVADNDKLIRTDPGTDSAGVDRTGENQAFLDQTLGEQAYDAGVLFSTEFGGLALLGGTCLSGAKGQAVTGHPDPVGSPMFVSIAAHELGHLFGADHSFNAGGGASFHRKAASAFEPGGGSTIMSYAGSSVVGPEQRLQPRMDHYFHTASIGQMQNWLRSYGGQCAGKRLNSNPAPYISLRQARTTIPARTPFTLDAKAFHPNPSAALTYAWEQMDLGPAQAGALADDGHGPIFRSYPPGTGSQRTFPSLRALLGEEPSSAGEVLPTTTRNLNFRLTVRDNHGVMANTASANTTVQVIDTGKAFAVTTPKALATWRMGTQRKVRWQTAGTDRSPINCSFVTIELSTDGGHSYPHELSDFAFNFLGQSTVSVPRLDKGTSRGRVRVRCRDNIFFALSDDFIIRK